MVEHTDGIRQLQLKMGRTPVLKATMPEAQGKILATQRELEVARQTRYEAANELSQDPVQMELWRKLKNGGRALMPDHEDLLRLAEKILAGGLRLGRDGWVESAENPEQNEQ